MNKKLRALLLSTLPACLSFPALAETQLNVVGTWSSVHLHKDFEVPFWTKTLPEASEGRILIQLTPFDQMGLNGNDVFTYLRDGLFNVGMTYADYVGGESPELEGLDLPMMTVTPEKARQVADAFMPIAEKVMQAQYNAHVLAIAPNTRQVVFCNAPIKGLADLQGKKIRASGRTAAEFLGALGAQSTSISFNEVPGALEQGVIDCAVTSSVGGYNAGWQDVSGYLLPLPVAGWDTVITAIGNDTWNALDQKERDLIETQIAENFMDPVWNSLGADDQEGIDCLIGKGECKFGPSGDMTLVEVTQADLDRGYAALVDVVLPNWAGRIDADIIEMWNAEVAPLVDLPIAPRQ